MLTAKEIILRPESLLNQQTCGREIAKRSLSLHKAEAMTADKAGRRGQQPDGVWSMLLLVHMCTVQHSTYNIVHMCMTSVVKQAQSYKPPDVCVSVKYLCLPKPFAKRRSMVPIRCFVTGVP